MQRLLMATALVVSFPFVASAADLQPGESSRELTTAELDSVTAVSSKRDGLLDVDVGVDADGIGVGVGLSGDDVEFDAEVPLPGVTPIVDPVGDLLGGLLPGRAAPRH